MASTWVKINSIEKQKRDELEIIDIISKSTFRDRYLAIGYIFKLQSAGLYIPSLRSLKNYCEESIVLLQTDEENKNEIAVNQEENGHPIWYWLDDKIQPKKQRNHPKNWCSYGYQTNRRIECAIRYQFRFVKVDDQHFVDLKEMIQIRYNDKSRSRQIKRSNGKITNSNEKVDNDEKVEQTTETTTTTTTTTTTASTTATTPDKNNENEEKEIKEIIKWYWSDDTILGGPESKWVEYNNELSIKIENQYQRKSNSEPVKIDQKRFVDTSKMLQIRYDSLKGRPIKREVVSISSSILPVISPIKIITDLFNNTSINNTTTVKKTTNLKLKETPNTLSYVLTLNQLVHLLNILNNPLKITEQQSPTTKFVLEKCIKSLIKTNNRIIHFEIKNKKNK